MFLYLRCLLIFYCCFFTSAQYASDRECGGLRQIIQRMVEKLQRHELRAQQVGEETLRALASLDGNQAEHSTAISAVATQVARLSDRLTNIENKLNQNERDQTTQLVKAVNNISNKLKDVLTEERGKQLIRRQIKKTNELQEETNAKLDEFSGKLHKLGEKVQSGLIELTKQVSEGEATNSALLEDFAGKLTEISTIRQQLISSIETEIQKFKNETYNEESQPRIVQDISSLEDISKRLQEHSENLSKLLEEKKSGTHSENIDCGPENVLNDVNVKLKTILYKSELYNNETQERLEALKTAQGNEILSVSNMNKQLVKSYDEIGDIQGQIKKRLADSAVFAEVMWEEVGGTLGELVTKLSGMEKLEKVVLDSADLSLDTKRRLEYGIQQILLEVEDLIRTGNDDVKMNSQILSEKMLINQTTTVTNITAKLLTEISQVWRQINFMYLTLSDSQSVLETVENQTKAFVNDSLSQVKSMDGQVGQVLYRMADVESNLNHLLGRLSLVVHEFNEMKYALGSQFDHIRNEFSTVYSKIAGNDTDTVVEDDGPEQKGPIPIDEKTLEELGLDTTTQADASEESSEEETTPSNILA